MSLLVIMYCSETIYLTGPLAFVAAVMQLVPINQEIAGHISADVKNVCNATLSLLFTVSLFIWGLLVNRKQAWRTDGGTAVFGAAALTLALISTALNFIYVDRQEEVITWLPGLMWVVVLWQSFLGWWWWVGAGSGSGLGGDDDVEEKLRKEARKEDRRREAEERRQETKKRARKVWKDVAGAFGRDTAGESSSTQLGPSQVSRIRTRPLPKSPFSIELPHSAVSDSSVLSPPRSVSTSESSSAGTSTGTLPRLLPDSIHRFYASVRRAHLLAARQQAAERVKRIRKMERNGVSDVSRSTWGVSNLLWRTRIRQDGSPGKDTESDAEDNRGEGEYELDDQGGWQRRSQDPEEIIPEENGVESGGRPVPRKDDDGTEVEEGAVVVTADDSHFSVTSVSSEVQQRRSMWWWGPLERWRLKDSTNYS